MGSENCKVMYNQRTHVETCLGRLMTPRFHCSRHGLDPWLGRSCMAWSRPDQSTPVYFSSFISGCGALDWVLIKIIFSLGSQPSSAAFWASCLSGTSSHCHLNHSSDLRNHPCLAYLPLISLKRLLERPAFHAWKEQGIHPWAYSGPLSPTKRKAGTRKTSDKQTVEAAQEEKGDFQDGSER